MVEEETRESLPYLSFLFGMKPLTKERNVSVHALNLIPSDA